MKCWSRDLWFATHQCPWCRKTHTQWFTCKRSICSSCSKPRVDKRTNNTIARLPTNIAYIHVTFTLPEELRDFWLIYRDHWILSILFNHVHAIIRSVFEKHFGCKPWIFSIIHTLWSAVNRNPHIHCVVTCWWINIDDQWNQSWIDIKSNYIPYTLFNATWRPCIGKECNHCFVPTTLHHITSHTPRRYDYCYYSWTIHLAQRNICDSGWSLFIFCDTWTKNITNWHRISMACNQSSCMIVDVWWSPTSLFGSSQKHEIVMPPLQSVNHPSTPPQLHNEKQPDMPV